MVKQEMLLLCQTPLARLLGVPLYGLHYSIETVMGINIFQFLATTQNLHTVYPRHTGVESDAHVVNRVRDVTVVTRVGEGRLEV